MDKPITHQLFAQRKKKKIKRPHLGLKNLHNQHHKLKFYFQLYYQVFDSTSQARCKVSGFHIASPWI